MARTLLAALVLAVCAFALAPSCNASVTEGCLDGPCVSATGGVGGAGGSATVASVATGTGTGGKGTGGRGTGGGLGADACPPTPKTGDFPCNVFAVVHENCNPCHQSPPKNNAPFPLLTFADTQQLFSPGKLIFQQMYDQTRPDACPRMPLGGMLDPADYATLSDWLLMCAPPEPSGQGCGCVSQWSGPGCTPL